MRKRLHTKDFMQIFGLLYMCIVTNSNSICIFPFLKHKNIMHAKQNNSNAIIIIGILFFVFEFVT